MPADDDRDESFGEMMRSIVREFGESIERLAGQVDVDEFAGYVGVDPHRAREWVESTASWVGGQLEHLGDEVASRASGARSPHEPSAPSQDPLRGAEPHPLDLPSEEQGRALAALDSGRWTIEPATSRLVAQGDGPGPNDALGLVRELRARDWIAADGAVTLTGQRALKRWLEAAR